MVVSNTSVDIGSLRGLELLQQQLQKHQQALEYQAYLVNQLKQQHQANRSQQMHCGPQSISRQHSVPTLNDLCYQSKPAQGISSVPSLPQPPCVSLQRRDSVKSDGSQSDSASSRYKTELCRPFEETGHCRYGSKCQFAHGAQELRSLNRHPRYKTEFCRTFHTTGFCSYGQRCNFIHNEEERRSAQQSSSRPQALSLNTHPTLKHSNSTGSTGSSPASSIYGDASPIHTPSYPSDDNLSLRMSPTPSVGSSDSFPSPTIFSDDSFDSSLSSPLDLGLSFSLMKLKY